jgi:hypothetical protein
MRPVGRQQRLQAGIGSGGGLHNNSRFDRTTNTGKRMAEGSEPKPALQTIYTVRPSHVTAHRAKIRG